MSAFDKLAEVVDGTDELVELVVDEDDDIDAFKLNGGMDDDDDDDVIDGLLLTVLGDETQGDDVLRLRLAARPAKPIGLVGVVGF